MPKRTDMSKILAIGVMLLAWGSAVPQAGPAGEDRADQRHTLPRICGKLSHERQKKQAKEGYPEGDFEGVRNVRIRLYRRQPGADCCNAEALVAGTTSGRGGGFSFKVKDGSYWLVAEVGGRELRMPVRQDKKADYEDFLCSNNLFAIGNDGSFQLVQFVTVD